LRESEYIKLRVVLLHIDPELEELWVWDRTGEAPPSVGLGEFIVDYKEHSNSAALSGQP
jgi:hypothetical protein